MWQVSRSGVREERSVEWGKLAARGCMRAAAGAVEGPLGEEVGRGAEGGASRGVGLRAAAACPAAVFPAARGGGAVQQAAWQVE